jgi:sugar (pentulose or hexulose) kinase
MLDALGLSRVRLPEVQTFRARVGVWEADGQRIPCYPAVGDFQAAMLGALLREGELSLNISTGSQVSLLTPERITGDYQSRPYFDSRGVITDATVPAGRSLAALIGLLMELAPAGGDPWPAILAAADAAPDPTMQVDLAFFESATGGSITAISEAELHIGPLFRAAFRSMAEAFHTHALRLDPHAAWSRLVFSGGLAHRSALLRRLISERFGLPWRLASTGEDTLLGLLVLARVIAGLDPDLPAATAALRAYFGIAG